MEKIEINALISICMKGDKVQRNIKISITNYGISISFGNNIRYVISVLDDGSIDISRAEDREDCSIFDRVEVINRNGNVFG